MSSASDAGAREPRGLTFWQGLVFTEPDQLLAVVKICEEVGFDGVIIGDHLLNVEQVQSRYPYSVDGKAPFSVETAWPEAWSTIGAMAAGTTGILSFPFTFTLRPTSTVQQKRAYLERYASDVISKMRGRGWV